MKIEQRVEFKYKVNNISQFINTIKSLQFNEIYEKRKITSLYLDTYDFKIFKNSLLDDVDKSKIRIRIYDDNYSNCTFEEKLNLSSGKYKKTKKFSKNLIDCINTKNPLYKNLYPASIVEYDRSYFVQNEFRITIDSNICFKSVEYRSQWPKVIKKNYVIAEFKLNENYFDEFKINSLQPIKFSKYESSINELYEKI